MLPATFDAYESERAVIKEVKPESNSSLKGVTVLCLDNDDSVLRSLVNVLEDWGCDVLAANNYDQAVEFMSADVDVILVQDTADRYGFSYLRKPLDIEKLNQLLISFK